MTHQSRVFFKKIAPHLKNVGWSSIEYLFTPILTLAATPLLVKSLGTQEYGLWMLVNTFIAMNGLADLGMGSATVKYVASHRGRNELGSAARIVQVTLALGLVGGFLVSGVILSIAPWLATTIFVKMGSPEATITALYFAALILLLQQIDNIFNAAIRGLECFDVSAKIGMLTRFSILIASVSLALQYHSLGMVLAANSLVIGLGLALKAMVLREKLSVDALLPKWDRQIVREVFGFSAWSWIQGIAGTIFYNVDRLLIGSMLGAHALTYYSVCVQLAQQIHALPAAGLAFLFPFSSRSREGGMAKSLRKACNMSVVANWLITGILGMGLMLGGSYILDTWMGPVFTEQAEYLLGWLALAYTVLSLNIAPHYWLLGYGQVKFVSVSNILGGILAGVAALLLIPKFGLIGAAVGRLLYGPITMANYWQLYIKVLPPANEHSSARQ